ncbi:MAG: hypothetical protein C0459_14095 [Chitinophaga sp.]|jgi:hypothetical protein|nr:hypothetical protein [Chitinophaga sp.]
MLTNIKVQVCDARNDAMSKGLLRRNTKAGYINKFLINPNFSFGIGTMHSINFAELITHAKYYQR